MQLAALPALMPQKDSTSKKHHQPSLEPNYWNWQLLAPLPPGWRGRTSSAPCPRTAVLWKGDGSHLSPAAVRFYLPSGNDTGPSISLGTKGNNSEAFFLLTLIILEGFLCRVGKSYMPSHSGIPIKE